VKRCVGPELLDHLPAHAPGAVHSRRDLVCVNALMGHAAILARGLMRHTANGKPRIVLDIGSGDGTFMLRVARRLAPRWPDCRLILLDRQKIVSDETRNALAALRWTAEVVAADVFDFLGSSACPKADVVVANLFLHHFRDEPLSRLLALIAQRTPLFLACEPRRGALAGVGSRLLWALGCNRVTLHDAAASVRAGFRGGELAPLWPRSQSWELHDRAAGPFSHSFVARRRA
jgi:SAM-dependent methyltransferase